jgi:hypothetical protein
VEQTVNGDYEFIEQHTFQGVGYHRTMLWKGGSGHIGVGVREIASQLTNEDIEGLCLPVGWNVVVANIEFKLVRRSS